MTDINNYKFEEYQHGQTTGYGTSKIITSTVGDTQIIQDNTQIDPSTYFQGDNAIFQASAGMGELIQEMLIILIKIILSKQILMQIKFMERLLK